MYIVIEGQDATGKSTQVEMLANYLREQGKEVVTMHEPDGDLESAHELRRIIKDKTYNLEPMTHVLLFTAARQELWRKLAEPVLKRGGFVVSARIVPNGKILERFVSLGNATAGPPIVIDVPQSPRDLGILFHFVGLGQKLQSAMRVRFKAIGSFVKLVTRHADRTIIPFLGQSNEVFRVELGQFFRKVSIFADELGEIPKK